MHGTVKRIRMRRALAGWLPGVALPSGFHWQPWSDSLVDVHASVKFLSFEKSIDAEVFTNLSGLTGCRLLMNNIRDCEGFCPQATWLLMHESGAVGSIQGLLDPDGAGSIQNVGVLPVFRRRGLGTMLVAKALHGFRNAGAASASLEVTAGNPNALRLYRRLGFKHYNSFYRHYERAAPALAAAGI